MQIVKQLNPINTTIYIEFDMIIDVDFGLLRYVGLEFADDRIFYTEIFENDDNVIKGLLMEREKCNPLTVPAIDEADSELLNKLYDEFFEKYKNNLTKNGVIISDNLSFHGMVDDLTLTHNYSTKKLVKKIQKYVEFLKTNEEFETEFFEVGDRISISRKKSVEN